MHRKEIGQRLQLLRKRKGLSIRKLATKAEVTASMISRIERGNQSLTVSALHKILSGLDTSLAAFFSEDTGEHRSPIFLSDDMRLVWDGERSYTIILPQRDDITVEMLDQEFVASESIPEFETVNSDVAGYVIEGLLAIEIAGEEKHLLKPRDGFYIPNGTAHRYYAAGEEQTRVIAVYTRAAY